MATSWKVSLTAGAAALALLAGIAAAKSHGHGKPLDPGGGKTHGSHGKPQDGGHGHGGPHGGGSCDGASSLIGAFVDETCPCAGVDDGAGGTIAWKNHGQYVRCVAHAVRDAAHSLGVKRRCVRRLVPCAAHSSCGRKTDLVACTAPVSGACAGGTCGDDPALPCASDADCPTRECSEQSPEDCTAAGGTATGSCCFASPSGAFVD